MAYDLKIRKSIRITNGSLKVFVEDLCKFERTKRLEQFDLTRICSSLYYVRKYKGHSII